MSPWIVVVAGFLALTAGSAAAVESSGVIRGRINFTGTIPTPQPLRIGGDRVCEDIHKKTPIMQEEVTVNPNKTLKNVVVWITSGGPDSFKPAPKTAQKAVLTQQGCTFYPRVLAVQVGQPLEMRNADPTIHNINAIPRENKRFNKAMIGEKTPPQIVRFDKPEVAVKLKCDIHPWMVAWVAVFDHPLFAISSEDGTFEIPDLPPGEYVLQSWHEKFGGATAEVLVKADAPAEVIFTYTDTGSVAGTQVEAEPATGTVTLTQP